MLGVLQGVAQLLRRRRRRLAPQAADGALCVWGVCVCLCGLLGGMVGGCVYVCVVVVGAERSFEQDTNVSDMQATGTPPIQTLQSHTLADRSSGVPWLSPQCTHEGQLHRSV